MSQPRILFVLRNRARPTDPGCYGPGGGLPSGITVSVQQLIDILRDLWYDVKVVSVDNNNFIHQEVEAYKPTHVLVEGFWVVPEKFQVLQSMHPDVHWVVRCHSNTEFLATEGNVFGWALDYLDRGITVGFNSPRAERDIRNLYWCRPGEHREPSIVFLPNCYELQDLKALPIHWLQRLWVRHTRVKNPGEFRVGCFGAIRPLKNHMNQAIAALEISRRMGLNLKFFVNATSSDTDQALLNSLRSMFARVKPAELVEVPWQAHDDFLETLTSMDIVSQVSASETFNIVLADAVSVGVPVIGANIPWLDDIYQADPLNIDQIGKVLHHTWLRSGNESVQQDQRRSLTQYVRRSIGHWERWLRS